MSANAVLIKLFCKKFSKQNNHNPPVTPVPTGYWRQNTYESAILLCRSRCNFILANTASAFIFRACAHEADTNDTDNRRDNSQTNCHPDPVRATEISKNSGTLAGKSAGQNHNRCPDQSRRNISCLKPFLIHRHHARDQRHGTTNRPKKTSEEHGSKTIFAKQQTSLRNM